MDRQSLLQQQQPEIPAFTRDYLRLDVY